MKTKVKEKVNPKNSDPAIFSWLDVAKSIWYFLEEDKIKFIVYAFILSTAFLYDFVPAYIVGKIVDFFVQHTAGDSLGLFYGYSIFLGLSYMVVAAIRIYSKQVIVIMGNEGRARARTWGFERLTEFSLDWHKKENTGNKLQRIFTGADAVRDWMDEMTQHILKVFAQVFGAIVIFFLADIKLAMLISVYIGAFLLIEFSISKKVFKLSNEFNKFNQSAGGVYVESASNMLSIKALGGEKGLNERVSNREVESRDMSIKKSKAVFSKWFLFRIVDGFILIAFMYIIGRGVIAGTITIGSILVYFAYFITLRDAFSSFSNMHSKLIDFRSDLGQMMPIFKETEFIKTGNEHFPDDWEKIEIKDGVIDYGSGQTGLAGLSLVLGRHTKTGIAGLSGSGKSTLAKIILGLYAFQSGDFKIGQRDYYSIAHNETLNNISVVLQETELFNLSLRDNITMMRAEDPALLRQALEISELGAVVEKLPDGLDSLIGEKGYMLSGGERQRLGIARAIYKNSQIIILDEATSSLDSETEGKIMLKLLGEYGRDKTFLVIAHRLGTLRYTDNIAVMESGRVIEEGNYDKLMSDANSAFYRMNKDKNDENQNEN
jgi:ABC-type multidrug transport system fused ATPase/permease subunit